MLELGKLQKLTVVKTEDFGVYLAESLSAGEKERVLLPKKQVPEGTKKGDPLEVFLYRDSSDRLIATVHAPKLLLGEVGRLTVVSVANNVGAFLDFGLERDLLLPYREQTRRVKPGEEVLAALYVDKSGRLAATMKLYPYLKKRAPYQAGDEAEGEVYEISGNFGIFVAVDGQYSGLIPKKEAQASYEVGQKLHVRVTRVHEDGKLDLSAREKAYLQIDEDAEAVLETIRADYSGTLPFDDKADPEVIREAFGLSKAAFKRAVGHLYRAKRVELRKGSIVAKEEQV